LSTSFFRPRFRFSMTSAIIIFYRLSLLTFTPVSRTVPGRSHLPFRSLSRLEVPGNANEETAVKYRELLEDAEDEDYEIYNVAVGVK
ncbi:MAG: hypothetical protein ABEJ83_05125, partial [Candidatus Nanohaloarchaea archaeon]